MKLAVLALLAVLFLGCGVDDDDQFYANEWDDDTEDEWGEVDQAATSGDVAWWRGLTQTTRNQLILNQAGRDLGKNVGLQCKPWVQRVVSLASKGVATVPATCPNSSGWYWCAGGNAVGLSMPIQNVKPGYIVQMNIKLAGGGTGPHTAIVYLVDSGGIWWLDSNFVGTNKVGLHYQTFATFLNSVNIGGSYKYSVYYIGP